MKVAIENRILRLTLDRPERGNSFSLKDAEILAATLKKYSKSDEVVGLLLASEGRLFCAGGDLSDYARMTKSAQGQKVNRTITASLRALAEWPKPTAVAVQGDCFGGGVELVSAFDKVFCVPDAFIGLWQRRIGLTFGWGGGSRLVARLGSARVKQLALETRSISALEALNFGLVDELVIRSSLIVSAEDWLLRTASLPQAPVAGLKTFAPAKEQSLFAKLWWNSEHRAALTKRRK